VAGLNRLIGYQPSLLDNWISNRNTYINKRYVSEFLSYITYCIVLTCHIITTTAHSNYAIRNYRHITGCTISTIVHDEMKSIPYYANHGNVHVQLILRIFIQKKLIGYQPSLLDNWISNRNTYINKRYVSEFLSYITYCIVLTCHIIE
jgi:hypothetical protein